MFQKYMFDPFLAAALKSADKAFIIEYISWSVRHKEESKHEAYSEFIYDGRYWMRDNLAAWCRRMQWLSKATIQRHLADLRQRQLIIVVKINKAFGDQTNFYRVNDDEVVRLSEPFRQKNQNEFSDDLNLRSSTSPQNEVMPLYRTKTPKTRKDKYGREHQFAIVFDNLRKLDIVKRKFETDEYDKWLTGLMKDLSLTAPELITLSNEWQEYHNDRSTKPKSPKGSFRTWVKNYVASKQRKPTATKTNLSAVGSDDGRYSDDWGL